MLYPGLFMSARRETVRCRSDQAERSRATQAYLPVCRDAKREYGLRWLADGGRSRVVHE